jgi:hypothetical protein
MPANFSYSRSLVSLACLLKEVKKLAGEQQGQENNKPRTLQKHACKKRGGRKFLSHRLHFSTHLLLSYPQAPSERKFFKTLLSAKERIMQIILKSGRGRERGGNLFSLFLSLSRELF